MEYFEANPPPPSLDSYTSRARTFVTEHALRNRRVAIITSGGTTVPLENQTVRFIDNFSAGTRGATSAEYFLEAGYAVIFLHRQFSLLPYSRHYSHSTNCFLDFMTRNSDGTVVVSNEYQPQMASVLDQYLQAKRDNALLLLSFTTVNEYLWLLRELAMLVQPLGANALFYLAAAVSDFFVPAARMVEHKIQSSEDFNAKTGGSNVVLPDGQKRQPAAHLEGKSLIIDLDPVPKFLKLLVDGWAPRAMIISFKLETDPNLLSIKAETALKKYAHHLVIGNLLNTRKWEVLFVYSGGGQKWLRIPPDRQEQDVLRSEQSLQNAQDSTHLVVEIESRIVPEVVGLHTEMIAKGSTMS